jgi:nucleoside-diphosphate-sugar epimerase
MRAFITGASGYIGARLATALADSGADVLASGVPGSEAAVPSAPGVQAVGIDLMDLDSLTSAARGADAVYHLAGALPGAAATDYQRINVEGTRNVALAAARAGVSRFVFLSSTAVYRPSPLLWPLTESAPLNEPVPQMGVRGYGESKVAAEHVLRELAAAGAPEATILRASTVYGPGSRSVSWLLSLLDRPPLPAVPRWGAPSMQWLYVDDLVRAVIEAGTRQGGVAATLNVAGGDLFSIYELLAAARRVHPGRNGSPRWSAEAGLVAEAPFKDLLRFSFAAASAVLDFQPTPLDDALPMALDVVVHG